MKISYYPHKLYILAIIQHIFLKFICAHKFINH